MAERALTPAKRWELGFYAFARFLVVVFCKLFWRLEVHGAHHVPQGPFVLAPVHRSNVDTPLAATVTRRRMRFMGKDSLWKPKPAAIFLTALGGFPVNRGTADREAMRRCMEVIDGGEPLVMFPEGTRREGPVVEDLFDGPAYVAARTGVPLVPVGIGGSEKAMPRGSKGLRRVKVALVVGPPIEVPRSAEGRVPRRAVRETTAVLRDELQRLFDEAQVLAGDPNPTPR